MFDAGAIEARLTIRTDQADRDLRAFEAKVEAFERRDHKIKISAVFDNSSVGNARRMFAMLDQSLSRDAMTRLRTSPQGSVLGALNALFSPHPVTGAPSAQQAGQQGLLGKMVSGPGGGIGQATQRNVIKDVLGVDDTKVRAEGAKAGKEAADAATAAAAKESARRGGLVGSLFGGLLGKVLPGGGGGGGKSSGGGTGGGGFTARLASGIGPSILGIPARALTIGALGATGLGALPALLGVGGALGVGGIGAGIIALGAKTLIGTKNVQGQPATEGPLYAQAQTAKAALTGTLTAAAGGLASPLLAAFKAIPGLLKGIQPVLTQVFGAAGTLIMPFLKGLTDLAHMVLPGLSAALRAVAPVIQPLLDGFGKLVGAILPGLVSLLKASAPAVAAFSSGLGTIGTDLGKMLTAFAPVIKDSAPILKSLFDVLGAILPIVGKLAGVFAQALAPVFTQFAGVIKSLLPFLTIVGKILASLAGAVLADLVAAFGALSDLLKAIAPSLTVFATAISNVFTTLENSGVFAVLGDAIEALAKPLANLINAIIRGLVPILPQVVKLVGELAAIFTASLVSAIGQLLPPLTKLATAVLSAIAKSMPAVVNAFIGLANALLTPGLIKAVTGLVGQLVILVAQATPSVITTIASAVADIAKALTEVTPAIVGILTGVLGALTGLVKKVPPSVLSGIALGLVAIWGAVKIGGLISIATNPLFLLITAITLIGIGIAELVIHWKQVWGDIKHWAEDAWNFIYHGWGKYLLPLLGPAGLIALAALELYQHWKQIWGFIKAVAQDFYNWIWHDFGQKIYTFFAVTLPGYITGFYHSVVNIFGEVINWLRGVPGKILGALGNAGKVLLNWGSGVIHGLLSGMTGVIGSVWNFIKGIPGKILNFLGIHSPPQWAIDAGKHIMNGIGIGMSQAQAAYKGAVSAFQESIGSAVAQNIGSGVARWKSVVDHALAMLGLPLGLDSRVLAQMQSESGGNPNAINLTDINAQRGDPSRGLMQVIGSTFAAYHVPGTSGNIYDPLANIAAAINYAAHVYGPGLMANGMGIGSLKGYASGGMITEPVIGYGLRTGTAYTLGERGSEMVTPLGGTLGSDGASIAGICARLDRLHADMREHIGISAAAPATTGRYVGGAIGDAAHAASFRSRYPRGGA